VNRDDHDKPLEPVVLKKVTVIPAGQPVPPAATNSSAPAAGSASQPQP
jgi:peptidyl-prolyl cis-trans isomerase A (cyclophilin A)